MVFLWLHYSGLTFDCSSFLLLQSKHGQWFNFSGLKVYQWQRFTAGVWYNLRIVLYHIELCMNLPTTKQAWKVGCKMPITLHHWPGVKTGEIVLANQQVIICDVYSLQISDGSPHKTIHDKLCFCEVLARCVT